jgi:anti-anti-sigma factor
MALIDVRYTTVCRRGRRKLDARDADRSVVRIAGELGIATTDTLSNTLARAIELDDTDVVVDLGGVRFLGVAAAAVFLRARHALRLRSRSLSLRSPSSSTRNILDLCGLGDLIDFGSIDLAPAAGTTGALPVWVA